MIDLNPRPRFYQVVWIQLVDPNVRNAVLYGPRSLTCTFINISLATPVSDSAARRIIMIFVKFGSEMTNN